MIQQHKPSQDHDNLTRNYFFLEGFNSKRSVLDFFKQVGKELDTKFKVKVVPGQKKQVYCIRTAQQIRPVNLQKLADKEKPGVLITSRVVEQVPDHQTDSQFSQMHSSQQDSIITEQKIIKRVDSTLKKPILKYFKKKMEKEHQQDDQIEQLQSKITELQQIIQSASMGFPAAHSGSLCSPISNKNPQLPPSNHSVQKNNLGSTTIQDTPQPSRPVSPINCFRRLSLH